MRKQDTGKKLTVSLIVLALTILAAVITRLTGLETTSAKLIGSFAAVFLLTGVVWRFPFRFYCMAFGFEVLAAVLGSALNLYHYLGFYDKFVHYTSGIVLAEGGLFLIHALAGRRHTPAEPLLCRLFSMFFSIAGAGIWEIYEFTADNLLGINMQGDNTNTMGDIISGTLGALTWFGIHTLMHKRQQARQ